MMTAITAAAILAFALFVVVAIYGDHGAPDGHA